MSSPVLPMMQSGNAGEPLPSVPLNKPRNKKETKLPTPHPPKKPPNPASLKRVRKATDNSYVYPTREELDGSCRCISKKLRELQTLEEHNRQRYNEVKRAGKLGGLPPASKDDTSVRTNSGNGSAAESLEPRLGSGEAPFLEPIEERVINFVLPKSVLYLCIERCYTIHLFGASAYTRVLQNLFD